MTSLTLILYTPLVSEYDFKYEKAIASLREMLAPPVDQVLKSEDPNYKREYTRIYTFVARLRALLKLGAKCIHCGFDDPRALHLAYKIPWKQQDPKTRKKGSQVYFAVLHGEPGYQVLCANCNWIKRAEGKEQSPVL